MAEAVEIAAADRLQMVRILEGLSLAELERISRHVTAMRLGRRQIVYSPESAGEATYLLLDGKVKLFHMSDNGREVIVEIVQDGDAFGELLSPGRGTHTWAETLTECEIAALARDQFGGLLRAHPDVALRLVEEMSQRLQQRASQIEDLALRSVPSRVASTLLRLGEIHGTVGRQGITIGVRLTHQDIANMVAAARETVTSILVHMRADGIIHIERKHVRIADAERLQAMAQFN